MIYILPEIKDRPIKIVHEGTKAELDENGDIVISRKATLPEIAELFDVTVDDIFGDMKFGMITLGEGDDQMFTETEEYKGTRFQCDKCGYVVSSSAMTDFDVEDFYYCPYCGEKLD